MPTREQYLEALPRINKQLGEQKKAARAYQQALLAKAELEAQYLTGDEKWDEYLKRVQVHLTNTKHELAGWMNKIAGAYEDKDLRMVQTKINECSGIISGLDFCMSLPKKILKEAHEHAAGIDTDKRVG